MAHVVLTSDARDDLRDLDGAARKVVAKSLKKLEDHPEERGAPLGKTLTTYRKLVVGNRQYRIVYRVEGDGEVCVIWVIATRSDDEVYNLAVARLTSVSDAEIREILRSALDDTREL